MPKKSIYRQPGAQHFQLVHRSQRDPLIHDPDAGQHVLKPFERENARKGKTREDLESTLAPEERETRPNVGQASLFGVYYDDTEYDYMQHLRPVSSSESTGGEDGVETILLPAPQPKPSSSKRRDRDPKSFLKESASDVPLESLASATELAYDPSSSSAIPASISGFQPDMDQHLRQTLEALEDDAFVDDEFERADDFFGDLVKDGERDEGEDVEFEYNDDDDADYSYVEGEGEDVASTSTSASNSNSGPPEDDWLARFSQFKKAERLASAAAASPRSSSSSHSNSDSEGRDTITGLPRLPVIGGKRRRKGASDASGYSLTSSSMFRNEGLSTLDERFAKIEEEYASSSSDSEDDDTSTISGSSHHSHSHSAPDLLAPQEREDFDSLLDDFLDKYEITAGKMRPILPGSTGAEKLDTLRRAIAGDESALNHTGNGVAKEDGEGKKERVRAILEEARRIELRERRTHGDEEDEEDFPMPSIVGLGKGGDRWDVETILSTYSNLENHPRLISSRSASAKSKPSRASQTSTPVPTIRIELDPRTGLPLVTSSSSQPPSSSEDRDGEPGERRKAAVGRPKDETPEEKKARKAAVKEQRQNRRVEKKATRDVFANERTNQVKVQKVQADLMGTRKL